MTNRRTFLRRLCAGAALTVLPAARAFTAHASETPAALIVPFPAGGGGDVLARTAAAAFGEELGVRIWIDNRPGAGGVIGARHAAHAAPDGRTFGYATNGIFCVNPLLYPQAAFDPVLELTPVGRLCEIGLVGVLNPQALPGVSDLPTLIAHARAHPKAVNFASSGVGTTSHLAGLLFAQRAGVELTHVPYRGGAAAMMDVLSGRIPFMIDVLPNVLPHVRSGRVVPLGAASRARLAAAPEVPTFAEAGLAGMELSAWDGIVLPRGAAPELVERASAALQRALARPEVVEGLAKKGAEPRPGTPEEFARFIAEERPKWAGLVRALAAGHEA